MEPFKFAIIGAWISLSHGDLLHHRIMNHDYMIVVQTGILFTSIKNICFSYLFICKLVMLFSLCLVDLKIIFF